MTAGSIAVQRLQKIQTTSLSSSLAARPRGRHLEERLTQFPVITVPTITMEGDANGAAFGPEHLFQKVRRQI
jgi:hypothetical protein